MRVTNIDSFRRSVDALQFIHQKVAQLQQQASSGKRLLAPSDDPVAAGEVLDIDARVKSLDQYARNANLLNLRLSEQENAISSASDALNRVRELVVRGKTTALSQADRRYIAAELEERLAEFKELANSRSANGDYIFAGTAVDTPPFSRDASGAMVYNGNQSIREIKISDFRTLREGVHGAEVFMAIRNGNRTFNMGMNQANVGTGRIVDDVVTDVATYQAHDFRIVFSAPDTFDVINDTTGATVLAGQSYVDGIGIQFNGLSVAITGEPVAGDEFTIQPSAHQSIFTTMEKLIAEISAGAVAPAAQAQFNFNMDHALGDIDQALDRMHEVRATIGARQNALDSQLRTNEDLGVQLKTVRSELEDADMIDVLSRLARETTALEAAQKTFVRTQGLSLFNYI